ncbi:MAG: hypothetical protein MAG715_00221 [Methanonatronarchaeales archaeon]|nr:hypothetical protein [Methanonatronarchaeales archaeon]
MVEEQLLDTIKREQGLLQSEVWKTFDIDSKKASRLVRKLEQSGMIRRSSVVSNGSRTYLLEYNDTGSPLDNLFSGGVLAPCIECSTECRPAVCDPLAQWTVSAD